MIKQLLLILLVIILSPMAMAAAPVIDDASRGIHDDLAAGSAVIDINDAGTGNDTDADGDAITYSITAGNTGSAFIIDTGTGVISVSTPSVLDHTTTPSYSLTLSATDGVESDTATITITVTKPWDMIDMYMAAILPSMVANRIFQQPTSVYQFANYYFLPQIKNPDNITLTYSIINKPDWATFSTTTGLLTGIPTDIGVTDKITISASGLSKVQRTFPFTIKIIPAVDIAHKFGAATQGSDETYHYYKAADYAIDNNDVTSSRTAPDSAQNWLQIKLPPATNVYTLKVRGSLDRITRIKNASVYLTQTEYSGTLDQNDKVATLASGDNKQIITLPAAVSANYVVIKADDKKNLQLTSVEVYGTLPAAPVFSTHKTEYLVKSGAAVSDIITTLSAVDYQNELITVETIDGSLTTYWSSPVLYTISDTRFAIDSDGIITVNSALTSATTYPVIVTASDSTTTARGINSSTVSFNITVTAATAVDDVLTSGDVINTKITEGELIQATLDETALILSDPATTEPLITQLNNIQTLFNHLLNNDYSFDWAQCFDDKYCHDVPGLDSDFQNGATAAKTIIDALAITKTAIFSSVNHELEKLLVLTADKFRQSVKYPMDKVETDDNEFMRSLYSDHAIYNYRAINPVQPDMGTFSRSDFTAVTPANKTITIQSRKPYRSTGVYALPGQTTTITRNDVTNTSTAVFINTQSSDATKHYTDNGYTRPKYLQSTPVNIISGETINLTNTYGGPIEIAYNDNNIDTNFTFSNIGLHPYWSSAADDSTFTQQINAGVYNWAEIATAHTALHTSLHKLNISASNPKWGSTTSLAAATLHYTSNYPSALAGLHGQNIDNIDEVSTWAIARGLNTSYSDFLQHINADQSNCDDIACPGNPYNADWSFQPTGQGDLLQLGNNLQSDRFLLSGWDKTAISNLYAAYTKSQYNQQTSKDPSCNPLPFKPVYNLLQNSASQPDPTAYMLANLDTWQEQSIIIIQSMMAAQTQNKLINGWHLLPRLHIFEHAIDSAIQDWTNQRDNLGFSTYTLTEFNNITNNDWMLISMSHAVELDYRSFFDMTGIEYSTKASTQVDSFGYNTLTNQYYKSTPAGYCKPDKYGSYLNKLPTPVNGTIKW